jgi:hypothetical protein
MRRMLRVALGFPLSCSELGSSLTTSFFFPFVNSADGSRLVQYRGEKISCVLRFTSLDDMPRAQTCQAVNMLSLAVNINQSH